MKKRLGFTMIELLIVIAVLGILAVAVLAAINPIEQINRSRDTASKSDSEQLLSAVDRYNAMEGLWAWQDTAADDDALDFDEVSESWPTGSTCTMLENLGADPDDSSCPGTDEIKAAFIERLVSTSNNALYMSYDGDAGDSVYICFNPQSGSFSREADDRCDDPPSDFPSDACGSCPEDSLGDNENCICLP